MLKMFCRTPQKAKPVPVKQAPTPKNALPLLFYWQPIVLLVYIFVTTYTVTSVLSSVTVRCLLYEVRRANSARLREY